MGERAEGAGTPKRAGRSPPSAAACRWATGPGTRGRALPPRGHAHPGRALLLRRARLSPADADRAVYRGPGGRKVHARAGGAAGSLRHALRAAGMRFRIKPPGGTKGACLWCAEVIDMLRYAFCASSSVIMFFESVLYVTSPLSQFIIPIPIFPRFFCVKAIVVSSPLTVSDLPRHSRQKSSV